MQVVIDLSCDCRFGDEMLTERLTTGNRVMWSMLTLLTSRWQTVILVA